MINSAPLVRFATVALAVFIISSGAVLAQMRGVSPYGGTHNVGLLFKTDANGANYSVIKEFQVDINGSAPEAGQMVKASNGKLYGVTVEGGAHNDGVLFEFDPSTGIYTNKSSFQRPVTGRNPRTGLMIASNGRIYGVTQDGGTNDDGVLFEYDPVGDVFSVLFHFDWFTSGTSPGGPPTEGDNGKLYGTCGAPPTPGGSLIYEYDLGNSLWTPKKFVPPEYGAGNMIPATNGKMYGLGTLTNGPVLVTIFEYDYLNNVFTHKAAFAPGPPWGAERPQGTNGFAKGPDGKFYGLVNAGGNEGRGMIFSFDPTPPNDEEFVRLHEYVFTEGHYPYGRLLLASNNKFYGTTSQGLGIMARGSVFEFDPATGQYTEVKKFTGPDGALAMSTLVEYEPGRLFGTTREGGTGGSGSIFEYNFTTAQHVQHYAFSYATGGANPSGGMTLAANGKLYGVTKTGGNYNGGTIYELNPVNDQVTRKFSFSPSDGKNPMSAMTAYIDGKLYGLTNKGGGQDRGVIFEYDPVTNVYTKKFEFNHSVSGSDNQGSLVMASNGKLYGMSSSGGVSGFYGVIFEYDPRDNTFAKKVDLHVDGGVSPVGTMVPGPNGNLYGLTRGYGTSAGVIFEFDPLTGIYTKRHDFTVVTGSNPTSGMTLGSNGKFYGQTREGGANSVGVIFEFDPSDNGYSKKYDFDVATGIAPGGYLSESSNGKFYGLTEFGGANNQGTLFEYDYLLNNYVKKLDLTLAGGQTVFEQTILVELPVAQSILFNPLADHPITVATFELTARSTSGLPISYSIADPSVATVSGNTVTVVGFGSTTVTATQAGNAGFKSATPVERMLNIVKGSQTITLNIPASKSPGDAPFAHNATSTSGLAVTLTSSHPEVASISGNEIVIHTVGSTDITATQAGNQFYNAAPTVVKTLVVAKASQTITFAALPTMPYSPVPFQLTGTSSSMLPLTYSSSDATVATVSGSEVTIHGTGTTNITATQAGNDMYQAAAAVVRSLVVVRAPQTITFATIPPKTFGESPFAVSPTSSAGVAIVLTAAPPGIVTIGAGNVIAIVGTGVVTVTASHPGNSFYEPAASVSRTFEVTKGSQSITFPEQSERKFGTAPFTLNAVSSSGLPVEYTSLTPSVVSVSGNTVTILSVGTAEIEVLHNGNANYLAAAPVRRSFTVAKGDQLITIPEITAKKIGDVFASGAVSSSSQPIVLTGSTHLTISGLQLTAVTAGLATITANQPANANYNAAPVASRSFCISPSKPVITANADGTSLTSSSSTGNSWFRNGTLIAGATGQVLAVSEAGTFTVQVTVEGCASEVSAPMTLVVTGLNGDSNSEDNVNVYPNPARDMILIQASRNSGGNASVTIYDMLGRVFHSATMNGRELPVDVSTYPAGIFIVKVADSQGVVSTRLRKE